MSCVKKIAILLVILAFAILGGLRVAQVISAKKEDPKRGQDESDPPGGRCCGHSRLGRG